MVENAAVNIADYVIQLLENNGICVDRVVIFGSYSRNEESEFSDLDLAIVSSDFEDKNTFERIDLIKDSRIKTIEKFMIPLDLALISPSEWEDESRLIVRYAKQGEVIFSA